jgi:hypothetical protein
MARVRAPELGGVRGDPARLPHPDERGPDVGPVALAALSPARRIGVEQEAKVLRPFGVVVPRVLPVGDQVVAEGEVEVAPPPPERVEEDAGEPEPRALDLVVGVRGLPLMVEPLP